VSEVSGEAAGPSAAVPSTEIHNELNALEPITAVIKDQKLKEDVLRLLTAEILARLSLRAIALGPFEEPEYAAPDIDMWDEMAQPVRSALVALLELRKLMGELWPETHDEPAGEVDVAFDLVDEAVPPPPSRDNVAQEVDDWVQSTLEGGMRDPSSRAPADLWKEVQTSLQPLASILARETAHFSARIRNPTVIVDRWMLLGDLQEFKGKFKKLLGALRLGVLHPFTHLGQAELLGEYRTEEQGSVLLRRSFYRLERDVLALMAVHQHGNADEQSFAIEELLVRLIRFSRSDAFALVRAPDKRALIEFRKTLAQEVGKAKAATRRITEIFEDLSKFLDIMHALNQREVLITHDKAAAAELHSRMLTVEEVCGLDLESARKLFVEAHAEGQALIGRDPMLNVWLDSDFSPDSRDDLLTAVKWVNQALARLRL
jgi:hypothetical protein